MKPEESSRALDEDEQDRRLAAVSIAIAAHVLQICAKHRQVVLRVDSADIHDAYALGEEMLIAGQLAQFFESRGQLMNAIRSAVVEHQATRCALCEPPQSH
jgi:hypothetical protein